MTQIYGRFLSEHVCLNPYVDTDDKPQVGRRLIERQLLFLAIECQTEWSKTNPCSYLWAQSR